MGGPQLIVGCCVLGFAAAELLGCYVWPQRLRAPAWVPLTGATIGGVLGYWLWS